MLASRRQVTGVALAVAVAACSGGRSDTGRQAAAAPSPGTGGSTAALSAGAPSPGGEAERVNVGDLGKEPSRYVGRRVTVEGPVANVLSESRARDRRAGRAARDAACSCWCRTGRRCCRSTGG